VIGAYTTPSDFELFKSLIDENIEHQSPMYCAGLVGYDKILVQGDFFDPIGMMMAFSTDDKVE
jgi:hypothetical protein